MSNIIVVFGSVTAKQYDPLRLAMLSRRLKPKIVRFDQSEQYLDDQAFFDQVYLPNQAKYLAVNEEEAFVLLRSDIDRAMSEYVQSALGEHSLTEIKALIFPHACASGDWLWFTSQFSDDTASYLVQVGEGDPPTYWLAGHGFGKSLPNVGPDPKTIAKFSESSVKSN